MPKYAVFVPVFCVIWITALRAEDLTVVTNDHGLAVRDHDRTVLEFVHTAPGQMPSADFVPTHYIHPLYGASGEVVTGESPTVWGGACGIHWGWSRLGISGSLINIEEGSGGRRVFERWLGTGSADGGLRFGVQNAWITDDDGQAKVIENLTFTVHPMDGTTRRIDVSVLIRNISAGKIQLEGGIPGSGLSITLNPERSDWALANSTGWVKTGEPYMSPWTVCTYRDDRRSTRSGLAILQDSRNPAFSTPNWLLEEGARLSAGTPGTYKTELKSSDFLEFRYRIILFRVIGGGPNMTAEFTEFMAPAAGAN